MTNLHQATLENRGVLRVSGSDTVTFLQGLISNDVSNVADDRTIYAALLTPQGKFLFDFFLYGQGDAILMETERDRMTDLAKKLSMFKLRAQVEPAGCQRRLVRDRYLGVGGADGVWLNGCSRHYRGLARRSSGR